MALMRRFKWNEMGEPPYRCQFCGAASCVDPSDQIPPPDYCHPSDHGTPEPLVVEATEEEILTNYYPHWCDLMRAAGKGDQISKEACLEDFMVVHWAWEVK